MPQETARVGVPLTEAALVGRRSYWAMRDRVLRGDVIGWKSPSGKWEVAADELPRLALESQVQRTA